MSSRVRVVILAGGLGTRLRSVLYNTPKPMAPVANKPFLYWLVKHLTNQGFTEISCSLGYLAEQTIDFLASEPIAGAKISWHVESTPLGTAGGFLETAKAFDGEQPDYWLILNGDTLSTQKISPMIEQAKQHDADVIIMGTPVEDTSRYGTVLTNEDDCWLGFKEKQPGKGLANSGTYLIRNECLRLFPKRKILSFERDVFPALLNSDKKLRVCRQAGSFLDIGTPESLAASEDFFRQHNLFEGEL